MKVLRGIYKWIIGHRLLSLALLGFMIGIMAFARTWIARSDGILTDPIERGTIVQSVYGIGTVTVNRSFQVKPGVVDRIADLFVREGDNVKKGDKLIRFDQVTWKAPFDGTVTFLPFKVGETVFPQSVVLTLVDLSDRYLVVSLEQQGALRVRPGQKVKMSFDSIREENYDGTDHSVYSNENNFLARIDVAALPARILPGMTADVAILTQVKDNVLVVPVAALEQGTIWVKRGYRMPLAIKVKTGIIDKDMAEISSGDLNPGDRILIRRKLAP